MVFDSSKYKDPWAGRSTVGGKWWDDNMGGAGQQLYKNPYLAVQAALVPEDIIVSEHIDRLGDTASETKKKQKKDGFWGSVANALDAVDNQLENTLGRFYADPKNILLKTPEAVMKGYHWATHELWSQPISTLMLMEGRAQATGDYAGWFSGKRWGDAYHQAEHISPGQASANVANTISALDNESIASKLVGFGFDGLSEEEKEEVRRNTDRFLYDTAFWREKDRNYDWKSGTIDFVSCIVGDPFAKALKVGGAVVKGKRHTNILEAGARPDAYRRPTEFVERRITQALSSTPEQAAARTQNFRTWVMENGGRTEAEIAQHPIWGRGRRRVNDPAVSIASNAISAAARTGDTSAVSDIVGMTAGDVNAFRRLSEKHTDLVARLGNIQERRALLVNPLQTSTLAHYLEAARTGRPVVDDAGRPIPQNAAFERPAEAGPLQDAWDTTYGHLAQREGYEAVAEGAIRDVMEGRRIRGMDDMSHGISMEDVDRAMAWKQGQVHTMDEQIKAFTEQNEYVARVLGVASDAPAAMDNLFASGSPIFGQAKRLGRTGPWARAGKAEHAAEEKFKRYTTGRKDPFSREGNFLIRTIRNGLYSPTIRMIGLAGDELPAGVVDHGKVDAVDRVARMLRRVPGYGQEKRAAWLAAYSATTDKVVRQQIMRDINTDVVRHMAGRHGLNEEAAESIRAIGETEAARTIADLVGARRNSGSAATSSNRQYSAAMLDEEQRAGTVLGERADMVREGEVFVTAPMAKSQLEASEMLLPVDELEKWLKANAGPMQRARAAGMNYIDAGRNTINNIHGVWKASVLLRPAYTIRSVSEESMLAAIRFGWMSTMATMGGGAKNFALNKIQYLEARVLGQGSYVPGRHGDDLSKGIVNIMDPEEAAHFKSVNPELKTTRVRVDKAHHMVNAFIKQERHGLKETQERLDDAIARREAGEELDPDLIPHLETKIADHLDTLDEFSKYMNAIVREARDGKGRRIGDDTFTYRGYEVGHAFDESWEEPLSRSDITSGRAVEQVSQRYDAINLGRMQRTGGHVTLTPGGSADNKRLHMEGWLKALNNQYRNDKLFRMVASDETGDAARAWLRTPEGQKHLAQMGPWKNEPESLIVGIQHTLDQYLPTETGLRVKLANGEKILEADLRAKIGEEFFPPVHGDETRALTKDGRLMGVRGVVDSLIHKGFNVLGTIPNDVMLRHPTFIRLHEANFRNYLDLEIGARTKMGRSDSLTPAELNKIHERAIEQAKYDLKQLAYDPKHTHATQALAWISPFFGAHLDGLARWGGMIAEKPEIIGIPGKIYGAAVSQQVMTDKLGRPVDENGMVTVYDPTTGKPMLDENGKVVRKEIPLGERIFTLRLPGRVPLGKFGEVKKGGFPISVAAINTILPGDPWFNPGTGPLVQITGDQIGKFAPSFRDFMIGAKLMRDTGATEGFLEDTLNTMLPKWAKHAWSLMQSDGPGNAIYQDNFLGELKRQQARAHLDPDKPMNWEEARKNARDFTVQEMIWALMSPAATSGTPLTNSPYQFFADEFQALKEIDFATAKDKFLAKHGEMLHAFTADRSKSTGVAATKAADAKSKEMEEFIRKYPEMKGLIAGELAGGGYSSTVYRNQFDEFLNGEVVRGRITAEQAFEESEIAAGWSEYNKLMRGVDAELIRSGFHSYRQKGTAPLNEMRKEYAGLIAEKYPAWERDFASGGRKNIALTIDGLKAVAQNEALLSDPFRSEIRTLNDYLAEREVLKAVLNARGGSKLSFDPTGRSVGENADIGIRLHQIQLKYVNSNTRFGDIYHRFLEKDDLS